ncbi:MAG: hypothetical protein JXR61_08135 [Prolixibacteraceae bacterium]|nr:hypothetical protein [Prolixibacteraceae bacterium]
MKKTLLFSASLLMLLSIAPISKAQEFSTGLDIYSSYIWRGSKFGTGPAFQPYVEFGAGDFAIGAWGSVNAGDEEALEMDLYASYAIGPISIAVTDYYFGGDWTDFSENTGTHYIEPALGASIGDLGLTAAYMFTPGFGDGDMYFEAAYAFESFDITLGAGDGAYTMTDDDPEGGFNICNIGIGTSKEVTITDSFSLPVSGAVILNPSTGGFFITVGISL